MDPIKFNPFSGVSGTEKIQIPDFNTGSTDKTEQTGPQEVTFEGTVDEDGDVNIDDIKNLSFENNIPKK